MFAMCVMDETDVSLCMWVGDVVVQLVKEEVKVIYVSSLLFAVAGESIECTLALAQIITVRQQLLDSVNRGALTA